MADDQKTQSLSGIVREKVSKKYGIPSLVVLAILGFVGYTFLNWEKVSHLPVISSAIQLFSREGIPKADSARFSILVTHLEHDADHEYERLIIQDLLEFDGIQVLSLDRTIPLKGTIPEELETKGHNIAKEYLRKSGASVLIWGTILKKGSVSIPKLYWTSYPENMKSNRYNVPLMEDQLRMPEVFWSDLSEILQLLVVFRSIEFEAAKGTYMADKLPNFISKVQILLKESVNRQGWDDYARGTTHGILGNALRVLGEQTGRKESLLEAINIYREALKKSTRNRVPLQWAAIQNNIGNALSILGEQESDTARLEEAVAAYREALKEYTRNRFPLNWAGTQNNLGNALKNIGERETGTTRIEEAVAAYREALKEYTRNRVPLNWAGTQNNLGNALRNLGERESGTVRLEEAVVAYREALKERTRDRVPLDWAMTQNNIGNALKDLGERESGTVRFEEAIASFEQALDVFESGLLSYYYDMTEKNLEEAKALLQKRQSESKSIIR